MVKKIKIGLKNKTDKIRLFTDAQDTTFEEFGLSHINFTSNRKVIIDGCKGVIDYNENFVCLNLGKKMISLIGKDLKILDFTDSEITIVGDISQAEFGD